MVQAPAVDASVEIQVAQLRDRETFKRINKCTSATLPAFALWETQMISPVTLSYFFFVILKVKNDKQYHNDQWLDQNLCNPRWWPTTHTTKHPARRSWRNDRLPSPAVQPFVVTLSNINQQIYIMVEISGKETVIWTLIPTFQSVHAFFFSFKSKSPSLSQRSKYFMKLSFRFSHFYQKVHTKCH